MAKTTAPPDSALPRRRRFLGALLALPALPWLGQLPPAAPAPVLATLADDFVIVDGWVLPARYFRS